MLKDILRKVDNALFTRKLPPPDDTKLNHYSYIHFNSYPLLNKFIPRALAEYLDEANKWVLRQYCYPYNGGCILEPDLGWAMTKKWELLPYSNFNKYEHHAPPPMYLKYLMRKKEIKLDKVISINYSWNNYGHFLSDIIGQLSLATSLGIGDAQIVVPAGLRDMAYFQGFMELSSKFRSSNWYFQEAKTFIRTDEAYFLNAWWCHKNNFDAAIALLDKEVLARNDLNGNNKIFVGRKNTRRIVNKEEVLALLAKYGFEYVEVEHTSLEAQIKLFMNASHVIGIHGAALSSIIFRSGKPLKFMELYTDQYLDPFYYWICVQYGFPYAAMLCQSVDEQGSVVTGKLNAAGAERFNLYVDVKELERTIEAFM